MKLLLKLLGIGLVSLLATNTALAEKKEMPEQLDGTTRVSAEELIELVETAPDLVIIDARKLSDHAKGWIEGAISLPNTETNEASLAKHIPTKTTPVLFYCNGVKCGRSAESAKKALSLGYSKIYWFRGGMDEWETKGYPVIKS